MGSSAWDGARDLRLSSVAKGREGCLRCPDIRGMDALRLPVHGARSECSRSGQRLVHERERRLGDVPRARAQPPVDAFHPSGYYRDRLQLRQCLPDGATRQPAQPAPSESSTSIFRGWLEHIELVHLGGLGHVPRCEGGVGLGPDNRGIERLLHASSGRSSQWWHRGVQRVGDAPVKRHRLQPRTLPLSVGFPADPGHLRRTGPPARVGR